MQREVVVGHAPPDLNRFLQMEILTAGGKWFRVSGDKTGEEMCGWTKGYFPREQKLRWFLRAPTLPYNREWTVAEGGALNQTTERRETCLDLGDMWPLHETSKFSGVSPMLGWLSAGAVAFELYLILATNPSHIFLLVTGKMSKLAQDTPRPNSQHKRDLFAP